MTEQGKSWREAVKMYGELYSTLHHREGTQKIIAGALGHFGEFLGIDQERLLADVGRERVIAYQHAETKRGVSSSSVNKHVRHLKAFFGWCVNPMEWIPKNPVIGVKLLPVLRKRQPLPNPGDLKKLLDWLDREGDTLYADLLRVAANTGARLGELLWIRADHVDLESRLLTIDNSEEHSTKDNDWRQIKLNEASLPILSRRKLSAGGGFLFAREDGEHLAVDQVSQGLRSRREAANIKGLTWYSLRHLFGTTMAQHVPELALGQMMGHSTPATTKKFYVHGAAMNMPMPPVIG